MSAEARGLRVVAIEDDPGMAELIAFALDGFCELTHVAVGAAALDVIRTRKPHLVMLDIHLPGLNGFELCEQIRADPELRATRILFMTTRRDAWTSDRARQAGGDGFLIKPFGVSDVRERVALMAGAM